MLDVAILRSVRQCADQAALPEEMEFYQTYNWCLNPYLTIVEAVDHLSEEVEKLATLAVNWQIEEIATNIFLLSCGILNCVDEYLRGPSLRLPKRLKASILGRAAGRLVETTSVRPWSRRRTKLARDRWLSTLDDYLSLIVRSEPLDSKRLAESGRKLTNALRPMLSAKLRSLRVGTPIPFRRLDLTPNDCLTVGRMFISRFPDRAQPILLLGLRTAGAYFAPLLRAYFKANGYSNVAVMTIEPNKGTGRAESRELRRYAAGGYWALIVDDAPQSSGTVLAAFNVASSAGFKPKGIKFLVPTHPAKPTWFKSLPEESVVTFPPEQWYKRQLLNPNVVERLLAEYFRNQNFARASVVVSARADQFTAQMQNTASDERGIRLKRVFEVELQTHEGEKQIKYVLAKSVGWGWLGYHAFLSGHRLREHVPPMLGLRDGILYMEWIPQLAEPFDRDELLEAAAAYTASRVNRLNLTPSAVGMDLKKHNNGARVLEKALSRGYGLFATHLLMRSRVGELVRKQPCPFPTLIDGNMQRSEWIKSPKGLLKTDYEHHGMGRSELNIVDSAYDLADTILNFGLSQEEERRLIERYIEQCGDETVGRRLFLNKLLAALWAMSRAQQQLFDAPRGSKAQFYYHARFMDAWNFLIVQTARHCGSLCHPPKELGWRAPLIVLDIDDVLDRRLFGFPCITAAGIKALSLQNAHELSIALNSARSAAEVKDYCAAYSLPGGIAEYGSYLWDAVRQREKVLISPEAERQLAELKLQLQHVPGVFLDERHRYSIRAFTYRDKPKGMIDSLIASTRGSDIGDGGVAPISSHIANRLLVDLQLDRLSFRQTTIDTTFIAKEVDKGTGLIAFRDWLLSPDAETIAVGDSESDLAMFRVASRCFGPSNLQCKAEARLLGCHISPYRYQLGLLDIVNQIVHSGIGKDRTCEICAQSPWALPNDTKDLFVSAIQAADQKSSTNLRRALLDRAALRLFVQ